MTMLHMLLVVMYLVLYLARLMLTYHSVTGRVSEIRLIGGYTTLGLRNTGEQKAGGGEYGKLGVHDLSFLFFLYKSYLNIRRFPESRV